VKENYLSDKRAKGRHLYIFADSAFKIVCHCLLSICCEIKIKQKLVIHVCDDVE